MVPVDFASFCLKLDSGKIVGAFKFMKFYSFNAFELLIKDTVELHLGDAFEKLFLAVLISVADKWQLFVDEARGLLGVEVK